MIELKLNDILILDIVALGYNGEGISKNFGYPIFVAGALPCEKVKVQITKIKSNFAVAKLLKIIEKSLDRIEPKCPYFEVCGGCCYQHLAYKKELEAKTNKVKDTFKKIAGIDVRVNNCVSGELDYKYRNKISLAVRKINNEIEFVLFEEDSKNYIAIKDCSLVESDFFDILNLIKKYLIVNNVAIYDSKTCKGFIRHIVLRKLDKAFQITIVTNGLDELKNIKFLTDLLEEKNIKYSLYQNINTEKSSLITSFDFRFLSGEEFLSVNILGLNLQITPASFLQVNNNVRDMIYNKVLELVKDEELVVDAYSGAGVLSCLMAKTCKKVIGIEIVKSAVESANKLCKLHNITNIQNYAGDTAQILPNLNLKNYTLVLDPPRKGVSSSVIETIAKNLPNKIIYVSCDETTLARDIKLLDELTNNAFNVDEITPFNMFPKTKHIETVVKLIKKEK